MKNYLFSIFLLLTNVINGQFSEDFSDGNFLSNPKWFGDTANFDISSEKQLQLNDTLTVSKNFSQLLVPVETADSTNWSFYVKLNFSPSTSNFARIFLSADQNDLTNNVKGYFLKIGGISGKDDAIELYRQSGTTKDLMIAGNMGGAGGSDVEAWVKVTRNKSGKFELWIDYVGSGNYDSMGVYYDGNPYSGKYFGWTCKYTSTRRDKFFLDDIVIDPIFIDQVAPKLLDIIPVTESEIDVYFDEDIGDLGATIFTVSDGIEIMDKMIDAEKPYLVRLVLRNALLDNKEYKLTIENILDLEGNIANTLAKEFSFVKIDYPAPFDIIINEIMADPSPVVGLPDAEYIELYNRTDKNLNLEGLSIWNGTSKEIGGYLPARSFLILCDKNDVGLFEEYGSVFGIENMPALSKNNDEIILLDRDENWIDHVEYFSYFYGDKESDGVSIERYNPNNVCDIILNWKGSTHFLGGTPGRKNENHKDDFNFESLKILDLFTYDSRYLELTFNKNIDQALFLDIDNFTFEPNITLANISFPSQISNVIILEFGTDLKENTVYELKLNESLTDCIGNPITELAVNTFGKFEEIEKGDLVINEILFNPVSGGSDFVEIYNRSDKILDVFNLFISNKILSNSGEKIKKHKAIRPKDYLVFSNNIVDIQNRYQADFSRLVDVSIPNFSDDEGNVTISILENGEEKEIDSFDYLEEYQNELISDYDGVSLERVSVDLATQDINNWESAAEFIGYGTPTKVNSQAQTLTIDKNRLIELPYSTFSPDGDGHQDFLSILYAVDAPGYVIFADIYNAKGQHVKKMFSNFGIGIAGNLKWNGITDDENKAPSGVYILWVQFVLNNGTVKSEKIPFVLAGKLN